ncbi:hypothetical protein GQ43DRAFT_471474 [Delitschia confertaspora ATCC 74209]|uniref:Uncharacterized protein n=1 Tax=Delitschia confertaspora ATCC 74209 TaxID=1513339 RepID=A0A9P4JRA1_9PLEO|nr:hypothetical protein GQ43DRAFT_471474 [Delitschia confertaspora ATCC 74209]
MSSNTPQNQAQAQAQVNTSPSSTSSKHPAATSVAVNCPSPTGPSHQVDTQEDPAPVMSPRQEPALYELERDNIGAQFDKYNGGRKERLEL